MSFQQKLDNKIGETNSLLCIGLDPAEDKLPAVVNGSFLEFNKSIVDTTHDIVCAYKPNSAFYEARGSKGIEELKATCDYIHSKYPQTPIILDAKRGDIGHTNDGYVSMAFEYLRVDAITLQPYLGKESLAPFLKYKDKGLIILCRTSNPGSGELQDLTINGKPLYKFVAENVVNDWNARGNCLMVVGATYPEELKEVRKIAGDMTFLVPGIGAQGGDIQKTVKAGLNSQKKGMIISSSRSVIFASGGEDFAQRARDEATTLRDEINKYR